MTTSATPIGCAFLNHVGSLTAGGIASLGGGEPFRFSSLDTLQAAGGLWVTSAHDSTFLLEGGQDLPYLRHASFLGTPVTAIAQELGVSDPSNGAKAVQLVSEVLTRVGGMVSALCGPLDIAGSRHSSLVSMMQSRVAPALRHEEMPSDLLAAMPGLLKAPAPLGSVNAHDITVRIPANRIKLAQIVLDSAVPAGDWEEVDIGEYQTPAMALSWAIGHRAPVMCYVTIRGPLPGVKATAPLMRNLTSGVTRWMALPEVVAMARLVRMTPKRIFKARDLVPSQASLRIPPPVFSPAAGASISANLLAEAYLQAVCSTAASHLDDGAGAMACPQIYSVRAAWLTSVARSYMIQEATHLAEANIAVSGFGLSHILVGVAKSNLKLLRKAITASSLLSYPAGLRALEEQPRAVVAKESHEMLAGAGEG